MWPLVLGEEAYIYFHICYWIIENEGVSTLDFTLRAMLLNKEVTAVDI